MASWVKDIEISQLTIPLTITRKEVVNPAGPIPVNHGETLYLSNLDDVIGCRVLTPTVYFYHSDRSSSTRVVEILGDALALVLVPYYPFSGRLREAKNGKLEVFFGPNQGALIVEAQSPMALSDLGDLSVPNPSWTALVHHFPNEEPYKVTDMPLLIAQITYFACGGFSLGLRLCHCLCDGIGAMQFFNAWASTVRLGSLTVSPVPCWDREYFLPRNPPLIEFPHKEFMSIVDSSTLTKSLWEVKPAQKCYKVNKEFLDLVKSTANSNNQDISYSTFDAMAAHIWRSWVKALDVNPKDFELRLTFTVNVRNMLKNRPLKDGFYGNVVSVGCATSTVQELVDKPLTSATELVHNARISVNEDYLRSVVDYIEVKRPKMLEFGGKLTITQWTRFMLYETADFGWGRPVYAGPIDLRPTPQVCVLLPEGGLNADGMLVCICLPESACRKFEEFFCLEKSN
ncbi:alcohol acyl transferase 1 allele RGb [Silene latifolia]|uniref:alcohol acyl transferase 1 allele RGb n=1 Tax=Silene latifolia TaxID=37657 RepID=UPI003D773E75